MHVSCLLGVNLLDGIHDKPLFLAKNWRDALCKCNNCLEFYNKKQIAFLLDKEDSAVAYEKMAKQKREEKLLQQQEGDSLEILKGVEDAIGQMKDEIRTFRVCFLCSICFLYLFSSLVQPLFRMAKCHGLV
jgi:E3 ubiquitin-protein ligase UBR7